MLRPRLSALSRGGGLLGLCLVIALASATGVGSPRAQDGGAPVDSAAMAESLRIADSVAVADSIAFEEEMAAEAGTFGTSRSILDRNRQSGFLQYSTNYNVNRGNRTWGQTADIYGDPGPVQVANVTTITITREDRIGRLSRNRSTRTELAYRVTPWFRVGGAFGLARQNDDAKNANFTALANANDDISAQARFNKKYGGMPVSAMFSYGYLDNTQSQQSSSGSTFSFYGSTSRDFGQGRTLSFDASQQLSKLESTVSDDPNYLQSDRNNIRDLHLTGAAMVNRWVSVDTRLATQRSRVERPARIQADPLDPLSEEIVVPEAIDGVNESADAGLHFRLPTGAELNMTGGLGRTEQVYNAEADRTSIASVQNFHLDFKKPLLGLDPSVTYDNSISDNDLTRRNPGWIESSLNRRLEVNANRPLSPRLNTRLAASAALTRRRYQDFRSTLVGTSPPSDQDNRRVRGSINLAYRASQAFDTGVTVGVEQNDVVNIARTSSINNATLRTYSVAWNWMARPGSSWFVSQTNSATAAQQYYDFTPDRDQLSFIYNLGTTISDQLARSVRLELNHNLRLQSRGTWRLVESARRYGKSSEFNTLDLNLRAIYNAANWLTLEAMQRLSASPNYTVVDGVSFETTESRRNEFTATARVNYAFSGGAGLNADIRRTLTTDRNRTFGESPTDRLTNTDYWLVTLSFRATFGGNRR